MKNKLAFIALILSLICPPAFTGDMSVNQSKRYFLDASGAPVFLIGYYAWASPHPDSYIDFRAKYSKMIIDGGANGVNYVRMVMVATSFGAAGANTDKNYDSKPMPTPYVAVGSKYNLNEFNQEFFNGVKSQIELALKNKVFVHISFFDGWAIRDNWKNFIYNTANQTENFFNASGRDEFYDVAAFENNTGIGKYQRLLIDKCIAEFKGYDNVFYEIGNETFDVSKPWYTAVVNYAKTKTKKPITFNPNNDPKSFAPENIDGAAVHWAKDAAEVKINTLNHSGKGYPFMEDPDGPALINGTADQLRNASWCSFTGGASGWGGFSVDWWDMSQDGGNPKLDKLTAYKNLSKFIALTGPGFGTMVPSHDRISNKGLNSSISNNGLEYIVYIPNDASVTVDISSMNGNGRFFAYDCKSGKVSNEGPVKGGASRDFNKPSGASDWALYIASDQVTGIENGNRIRLKKWGKSSKFSDSDNHLFWINGKPLGRPSNKRNFVLRHDANLSDPLYVESEKGVKGAFFK